MERTADKQISDILARFGEPFGGNVWRVQGTAVIYHKTLERIAAFAGIIFEPPEVLRAERDEAVLLVTGTLPQSEQNKTTRTTWSIGEAVINVNYRVSGKQAAYVYAMAEKRAKDRVILKLLDLHGMVYSEEEADEFRRGGAPAAAPRNEPERISEEDAELLADMKQELNSRQTVNAVTDYMLEEGTQKILNALAENVREEVRDYAKARLRALGWPPKVGKGRAV